MDYFGFAWRTAANRGEPDLFSEKCVYFFYILGLVDKVCRFLALHYIIKKHSKAFASLSPQKYQMRGCFGDDEPRRTVFGDLSSEPNGILTVS